jgi:hypothetical protein
LVIAGKQYEAAHTLAAEEALISRI